MAKLVVQEERDCCSLCSCSSWETAESLSPAARHQGQQQQNTIQQTLSCETSVKRIVTPSSYWGEVCVPYFENKVLAVSGKLKRLNPETFWFDLNHWKELHSSCAVCFLHKAQCWCWQLPAPRCWQQSWCISLKHDSVWLDIILLGMPS